MKDYFGNCWEKRSGALVGVALLFLFTISSLMIYFITQFRALKPVLYASTDSSEVPVAESALRKTYP